MRLEKRMRCMHFFFVIPFLMCCYTISGQEQITHYTVANGLSNDITYGIFQDHKGYIWIGTDDGLVKFDGNTFKTFTQKDGLLSNFVIDIAAYDTKTLALTTWGGGLHLLKEDRIVPVPTNSPVNNHLNKIESIENYIVARNSHSQLVKYRADPEKGIAITTYGLQENTDTGYKLLKLPDPQLKNLRVDMYFEKIDTTLYLINSPLYQAKQFYGVYQLSENFELENVFCFLDESIVTAIGKYNDTLFYAASKDNLLLFDKHQIVDTVSTPFTKKHIKRYIKNEGVEVFVIDDPDINHEEIIMRNRNTGRVLNFSEYYRNNALVSDLMLDNNRGIWITTYGNGVFHIPSYNTPFHKHYLENRNVIDVKQDVSGHCYLLTLSSLFIQKQDGFREIATGKVYNHAFDHQTLRENYIRIIKFKNSADTLFRAGKVRVKIDDKLTVRDPLSNIDIKYTSGVLKHSVKGTKKINNDDYIIKKVFFIGNKIWIIITNRGIRIHDINSMDFEHQITIDEGLSSNNVRDVFAHRDTVWIATSAGLNRYVGGHIKSYTTRDGLQGNTINSIYADRYGVLWIGTQKGLSVLKDNVFYNYDTTNGLPSTSVNKIYEDRNHQLWIAGNKGVTQIDNTKAYTPEAAPALEITQNETHFEFNTLSFTPGNTLVQYKVNNDPWITSTEESLNFDHFTYGTFTVQFKARKPNSAWRATAHYTFTIREPWYRKWYSITLFVVGTATVLIFLISVRLKQIARQNQLLKTTLQHSKELEHELSTVRENVARDFHDELGNKLAGITAMTDIILRDEKIARSDASKLVKGVKKNTRELYSGIKDFVWSIDAKSDSLEALMDYLTDFGEELYQNKGITFHTERVLREHLDRLPYYWSRQLLLLFKEAMTNALKHARATEVTLRFQYGNARLKISIADNGTGFNMDTLKRKNGLLNMKNRADKIGGKLRITTAKGTVVCFEGETA